MRLPGSLALVFMLLSAPAGAQSVKLTDLVGAWTRIGNKDNWAFLNALVFRSDSTTNWVNPDMGDETFYPIHRLSDNTIQFAPDAKIFKITLKDQQLILAMDKGPNSKDAKEFAYKRVDAPSQGASQTLTVHPQTMATGTRNPAAGEYALDSVPQMLVTVPPQCVGARRCPLYIQLPGGGISAGETTNWVGPVANKYGLILLAPTRYETSLMDVALKEILQRFAIDPEKIAIVGRCMSGETAMTLGINNLHVFSRIGSVSGAAPTAGMDPQNKTAEFLIDRSYEEITGGTYHFGSMFTAVHDLRRAGHPVKVVLALRGHEHQVEDYDYVGHWLQESWAKPDPTTRTAPFVADPLPLLTPEALTQMTTFWASFMKEPDSIRTTARRAHLREVVVPVGAERPSVWMVDMPALAAEYPSVAAALKTAGLTAEQHDAYRVAILSTWVTQNIGSEAGTVETTSALAKNIAFFEAHRDEFGALAMAGTADPTMPVMIVHPKVAEAMGPKGIWRTP